MTRQLEQKLEERQARHRDAALLALFGGLDDAVSYAGGELTGFSVRLGSVECLMTLRAKFPGGHMIAFVGAGDLPDALVKASREAKADALRWRVDNFKVGGLDDGQPGG